MVEPIDHGLLQVPVAEGAPVPSLLGHARQGKYLYDMSDDNEILKAGCFRKVDVKSFRVFIKYCGVFFQEFSIFCNLSLARTGLLLVVQKMASQ